LAGGWVGSGGWGVGGLGCPGAGIRGGLVCGVTGLGCRPPVTVGVRRSAPNTAATRPRHPTVATPTPPGRRALVVPGALLASAG